MKARILPLFALPMLAFLFASCDLETENPSVPVLRPAKSLVINEVFTLPPTNQRTYSWVELFNPTGDTVKTRGWTLSLTTSGFVVKFAVDSARNPIRESITVIRQGEGEWRISLPVDSLPFGTFMTLTNSESRLLTYTEWGPGGGPKRDLGSNVEDFLIIDNPDSSKLDTAIVTQLTFQLRTTDQLILRNERDSVVDVVRYGAYTYTGPGGDPYPNNHSIGLIPEYQSIARYNGAYFTGNTAEDFYITAVQEPQTRPIPHWLSQAYKK